MVHVKWLAAVVLAVCWNAAAVARLPATALAGHAAPPPAQAPWELSGFLHAPIKRLDEATRRQYLRAGTATIRLALEKGERVSGRRHTGKQLLWVVKGRVEVRSPQRRFIVRQGEVLIIPPDASHEVQALDDAIVVDFLRQPNRVDASAGQQAAAQ